MVQHHKFIDIVHRLGEKGYELKGVYRRIQDRALFLAAYGKLYANDGATTPGTDPDDSVDGMSLERIETLIEQLHSGEYRWKPARRVYVPKANGKRRPIGIPSWSDKMLQEVIRMVLTAYYEPRFSPFSHGFRPGKGCHTALRQIHHSWKGTKWFIEGDIKGCFDNIDHNVLMNVLARDIKDNRFLKLIRQMLRAGYMEDWRYQATYSGTPQGGIVSPILANILLNELDNFVQTKLFTEHNKGERRRINPEYQRLQGRIRYARKKGRRELVKELEQQRRQIPSGDPNDPTYRRLRYCRYADDFLLGYIGTHAEARSIKEKIRAFLNSITLEMSEEKTLVTHATTGRARFLGYDIHLAVDNNQITAQERGQTRYRRRALNMTPILAVPPDVARHWRTKYTRQGKPTNRPELLQCSDMEIVMTYGREFQGIVNYYSLAHNVAMSFYPVKHVFIDSAVRTLANKHHTSRGRIYAKYKRRSEHGVKALIVEARNPNDPDRPYQAKLGDKPIRVTFDTIVEDKKQEFYLGSNELVQRLLANKCELCGSTDRVQAHHVRRLVDVRKQYQHRRVKPDWAKLMMARRRKTVIVCHRCHHDIHNGTYDGEKVN